MEQPLQCPLLDTAASDDILDPDQTAIIDDFFHDATDGFDIRIVRRQMRDKKPRRRFHHAAFVTTGGYFILCILRAAEKLLRRNGSVRDRANRLLQKRVERTRTKFRAKDPLVAAELPNEAPQLHTVYA
ncbi:hypothetical protein GCM10027065_18740 [Rhodanobacter koreensis]